jgi:hypothetical protein
MFLPAGVLAAQLAGCSALLGIQNPSAGDAGTGSDADDAGSPDRLGFSLGNLTIAQGQVVRFHVGATYADGGLQDVTATATYTSDNPSVATFGAPGQLNAGTQAGTATITASLGTAMPATIRVTVTAATCHPVINELLVESNASTAEEWVELLNPCATPIDVTTWTLVYRGAGTVTGPDSSLLITLTGQMASGAIRLYAGPAYMGMNDGRWPNGALGGTDGAVGLRSGPRDSGPIVDAVAYGDVMSGHPFIETSPGPAMVNGRSAARLPFDGKDDNNTAVDFFIVMMPTPRAPNVP